MVQRSKPQFHLGWFPPFRVVWLLFAFIIFVSLAAELLHLATGISDETIEVFVFPIWEEMLKLWLLLKFSEKAFGAIITFGMIELIFVKGPFLIETTGITEALVLAAAASIVLAFHVGTAFAYRWSVGSRGPWLIFGVCVVCHILFNLLSIWNLHFVAWGLGAILISAIVVGTGSLLARSSSQTERT